MRKYSKEKYNKDRS